MDEVESTGRPWLIVALVAALAGTVVLANWLLDRYGLVTVGFGLTAPAGVYAAGLAFGLRDALHEAGGRRWVLVAIGAGALTSLLVEDEITIPGGVAPIAVASAAAFTLSELADLAVYEPLRERGYTVAVTVSNLVGAVVDSVLFLWLAFGALDHLAGQVVGKALMILPALAVMGGVRAVSRHRVRPSGA